MSSVKNKNSRDVIIPHQLRKKNPCPNLQNQILLFWDQDAFLNDSVQRRKRKACTGSSAIQKRSQISSWQPWNPSPFFTGLCRTAPTVFPYVNHAAPLWREVNKRNTYSWPSNLSAALKDGTTFWLHRKVIFEEDMNSWFLHKWLANIYFLYWFCFDKVQ